MLRREFLKLLGMSGATIVLGDRVINKDTFKDSDLPKINRVIDNEDFDKAYIVGIADAHVSKGDVVKVQIYGETIVNTK